MKSSILIAVLFTFVVSFAAKPDNYGNITLDSVLAIYDGDTFTGSINSWPAIIGSRISIRIAGIDTPEMRDKYPAVKAKTQEAKQFILFSNSYPVHELQRQCFR
jgi:endonuclease YncB( thermonuclease family)